MPVQIPRMFNARQTFIRPRVRDVAREVQLELERLFPSGTIAAGAKIGVTVGSRGIKGIAAVARAAVDFLKSHDAAPFIIPAMGSHGGAQAEAQAHLIAHYGVSEETMECPVHAAMETRSVGRSKDGVETLIAEAAWEADGILLMNRIKPHTDYKGQIESGLTKICAIGLGKYNGAREIHRNLFRVGLGAAIRGVTEKIIESGKIIGGIAILENAYHETAKIAAVGLDGFFEAEETLLEEARGLMGRLPLDEIDVLFCDRMGKNISGAGLDTNIIGRGVYGYVQGVPWCEGMPSIMRIVVSDLSEESDGNAVGMGLVEFVTQRFIEKVNHRVTSLNALTGCAPAAARTPVVCANDRDALEAAIRTSPNRPEGPRVVHVRDTLALEDVYLSEACLPLVAGREDIEVRSQPAPLRFDDGGYVGTPL